MNILTDALPEAVTIAHTEYRVDTDFRTCLTIILAFEDAELTPQEKQHVLLSMLFVDQPPNTQETAERAMWFLDGGHEAESNPSAMRLCSFSKDAQFIYSAFRQTHGIDLQTVEMHWWQFLALFMDMGQDTTFCQLTALRKRIKTGKASKEEQRFALEHPEIVDLPEIDTRTLEEKEIRNDFLKKVAAQRNQG